MPSVEARITKVEHEEGSPWFRILTDDARVRRLSTKIPEKAQEAAGLKKSGDRVLIEYNERPGNVNQHTGERYLDFYYERAGSIETPEDDGIDKVQATSRKTDPEDAWRMCLNKGGELAVLTIPHIQHEDKEKQTAMRSFEVQKQIAVAWARFFFFTPLPRLEELAFGGGNGFNTGSNDDQPPPHGDDDIPF